MRGIPFEGSKPIHKPADMIDEQCSSLDIVRLENSQGFPIIRSYWMPNKEDIEAINSGRGVWLDIIGHGMPPVSLFTANEKGEINQ